MMWSCTCDSPPIINLTDAFLGKGYAKENSTLLCSTLEKWGWCHVTLVEDELDFSFPSFEKSTFLQTFSEDRKEELLQQGAIYRGREAESGSSSSQATEPKQSWEISRCCGKKGNNTFLPFLESMHSVATAVGGILSFPKETMLKEERCHCSSSSDAEKQTPCNIDLLRVFLYDPDPTALGSSPHTDWGTLTVVWQDNVGGLETYCPVHQVYNEVSPQEKKDETQRLCHFVVHVGDVTSLTLGHASGGGKGDQKVQFPSPLHRVQCPKKSDEPRISLVYFCYPPPPLSLATLEQRIQDHVVSPNHSSTTKVPYDSYYLLQNQTSGQTADNDPEAVYQQIREKPLGDVFRAKWGQVQRE